MHQMQQLHAALPEPRANVDNSLMPQRLQSDAHVCLQASLLHLEDVTPQASLDATFGHWA